LERGEREKTLTTTTGQQKEEIREHSPKEGESKTIREKGKDYSALQNPIRIPNESGGTSGEDHTGARESRESPLTSDSVKIALQWKKHDSLKKEKEEGKHPTTRNAERTRGRSGGKLSTTYWSDPGGKKKLETHHLQKKERAHTTSSAIGGEGQETSSILAKREIPEAVRGRRALRGRGQKKKQSI